MKKIDAYLFGLPMQRQSSEDRIEATPSSDVAFFLGAGASVEAGVPDTAGLLSNFVAKLPSELAAAVKTFLDRLDGWAKKQKPPRLLDIELVLETLQHAVNWKDDPLAAFVHSELDLSSIDPAQLLRLLRDFVKDRVMVGAENIKYLAPLRGFIDQYKPLNIFSANYDTAIEVFCAEHKLKYRDGFDEIWNPRLFNEPDAHVRLFKIHGSVTWYRTDRGRFVKIPTVFKGSRVELYTKEQAELVMLYPAQKFEYVEPLFELTLHMKRELAQCRTLFVIGYSFRDEHLRRLFWDIAREHADFYVVLINPDAYRIYNERLKRYDDNETPSSLAGRVLCLPWYFGKVFPSLQSGIYNAFRQLRTQLDSLVAAERQGQVTHWHNCISVAGECGDYETLQFLLHRVEHQEYANYQELIRSVALALFHAIANGAEDFVTYFWGELKKEVLHPIKSMDLHIDINPQGNYLRPNLLSGRESMYSVIDAWHRCRQALETRHGGSGRTEGLGP